MSIKMNSSVPVMTLRSGRRAGGRGRRTVASLVTASGLLLGTGLVTTVVATPAVAVANPVSASPAVALAATPSGHGYWEATADGGVFTFGDAPFYGSMGGKRLNAAIIGMTATPSGHGYWLLGSDGGIFAFGDAAFYGSMGGKALNAPVVDLAVTPSGHGYWLLGSDGGIFAFGDAAFYGSMGGKTLNKPVVAMAATPSGRGYWLAASDGGIFAFGDAAFYGSAGANPPAQPMVTVVPVAGGGGYWMLSGSGAVYAYGTAQYQGGVTYNPSPASSNSSDRKGLAQQLLMTGVQLQTVHSDKRGNNPKDFADPTSEMNDTRDGNPARRSNYGNAPGGTVMLDTRMLAGLVHIAKTHRVRVSEIAGGSHSVGSKHYAGVAFDLDLVDGTGGQGNALPWSTAGSVVAMCRQDGASYAILETTSGASSTTYGNHVHCQW